MTKSLPVCLIPARGGSKRVPDKNIRLFFGHPLIAYTIAAARNSGLFSRVIVSTDSDTIGATAIAYGAEHLRRLPELASDEATLVDVALHAIAALSEEGERPEALCQLMPNCPLRRAEDIVDHYRQFRDGTRAFQISVVPYVGVYPHWALAETEAGEGTWLFGEKLVRSQELAAAYCPTGAIWWVSVPAFLDQRRFYGNPFHLAPIDAMRGFDIDHLEDFAWADVLVRGLKERDGVTPLEPVQANQLPMSLQS